ncbi:MAG: hypothetical protein QG646_4388 [Euryarchaeota archaeon]|nr:hypothetical protein [Euryarchaeota archaeon]
MESDKDRVKSAMLGLLELFRSGDIPEKIAIATNPDFDVPSSKWSLNNRLIQLLHGTIDSRGIKQWNSAGRKITKGAKALYILAPREYLFYTCPCGAYNYSKRIEAGSCKTCHAAINPDDIQKGIHFTAIPVFRAGDTNGKPLAYENIPVPQHKFMDVAKAWNLEVRASAFFGNAYGYYAHGGKIILASPEEYVFYHELAHAAHNRLGLLRKKHDESSNDIVAGIVAGNEIAANSEITADNEIVADFAAASLMFMDGKKAKLGNCHEYLEHYAREKKLSLERAVLSLLSEIEKVIRLILDAELKIKAQEKASDNEKPSQEEIQCAMA